MNGEDGALLNGWKKLQYFKFVDLCEGSKSASKITSPELEF